MKTVRRTIAAAMLCAVSFAALADTPLMIKDGWVREMPPGTVNTAAYFSLHNHANAERVLVGLRSDVADVVEMHTIKHENDTLKMQQINEVSVPSHGSATLKPGADHIMLIGLQDRLLSGQAVTLTLEFANGETQDVSLPVERGRAKSESESHAHSHNDNG